MLNSEMHWVPAVDPMHFDKPIAGVGPGRSFGIALAEADPTVHIGLVPAAVGGSAIASWVPGGIHRETGAYPYDEAIARTLAAMEDGELKGILWHQGESDSNPVAAPPYEANLRALIARFNASDNFKLVGVLDSTDAIDRWLDPEVQDPSDLIKPAGDAEFEAYPVSSKVGNPRNDGPALIVRQPDPPPQGLF